MANVNSIFMRLLGLKKGDRIVKPSDLKKGDHIIVWLCGPTTHHGIYIGNGLVVHWSSGMPGKKSLSDGARRKAVSEVRCTPLEEFGDLSQLWVREYDSCCDAAKPDEVVRRALSRDGEKGYSVCFNNCEHFATWCKTGVHQSEQVKKATFVGLGSTAGIVVGSALRIGLTAIRGGSVAFGLAAGVAIPAAVVLGMGLLVYSLRRTSPTDRLHILA